LIPITYSALSAIGIVHFQRTKNDRFLQYEQIVLFLILPVLVHFTLGGFVNSSGVIMYSIVGVLGAVSGMDVGPVVAEVIGESRFIYDVYGDTVNTASRMESNGVPNKIQITRRVAEQLDARFLADERGPIEIKGKGAVTTYFLGGSGQAAFGT
jgi:hypothetical protein